MTSKLTPAEQTFLELVAFDEVYPHEDKVLEYVKQRLAKLGLNFAQDKIGNIVAIIGAGKPELALVGHVDIAAPLNGRQVIVTPGRIKTDGRGLLGADDKAAVALMLELAEAVQAGHRPAQALELIFTVGEEAGCLGAAQLDLGLVQARRALVFDWTGGVQNIITQSPAYISITVTYIGQDAHPAEWQLGKNAGAALAEAVASLQQGEYQPGVICNVGVMQFGEARNKVPGRAMLKAEMRSFDSQLADQAVQAVARHFHDVAQRHDVQLDLRIDISSPSYELRQQGPLYAYVRDCLKRLGLPAHLEPTYGCFDGNELASRGLEVVIQGAGYHNPHGPAEYLDRRQFAQALAFLMLL